MAERKYKLKSKVFLWSGETAAWHFLGVAKKESAKIKEWIGKGKHGFGSVPVTVTLGKTVWTTSIFPDARSGTYLLPLKAAVRKAEGVFDGDEVSFTIDILT